MFRVPLVWSVLLKQIEQKNWELPYVYHCYRKLIISVEIFLEVLSFEELCKVLWSATVYDVNTRSEIVTDQDKAAIRSLFD